MGRSVGRAVDRVEERHCPLGLAEAAQEGQALERRADRGEPGTCEEPVPA